MAINYTPVGWDTAKYVNPTNMNHMDDGIKAACDGVDAVNENLTPLQTILNGTTTSSGNVVFQDFSENNVIIEARILDATYRKLDILKANGYGTAFTIFDIEGNRLANFDISIKVTYYPSALFN